MIIDIVFQRKDNARDYNCLNAKGDKTSNLTTVLESEMAIF